jgi:hypothetical protein
MNKLDPISIATSVAGIYYGPDIATVVGPYVVIILCSTLGTAWSFRRRKTTTKLAALRYFLLLNATALFVTVALAQQLAKWLGTEDSHSLLAPIALGIGAVGTDWPTVVKWFVQRFVPVKEVL